MIFDQILIHEDVEDFLNEKNLQTVEVFGNNILIWNQSMVTNIKILGCFYNYRDDRYYILLDDDGKIYKAYCDYNTFKILKLNELNNFFSE